MKNAIILHGTGDSPDLFWFPYLARGLKKKGFNVQTPALPNAEKPNLKDWLSFILASGNFSSETVIVGHSSGARLILSILENIDVKIKQAILVSGYAEVLPENENLKEGKTPDWKRIKQHVQDIIFINSDNDPWGCDDKQGRIMFDNLGGTLIIKHEGHMGSTTHNQPYRQFPFLLKLITG